MHRLIRPLAVGLLLVLLVACGTQPAASTGIATPASDIPQLDAVELHVFAAASLTDAFKAIRQHFEAANPGTMVVFNFAGSDKLAQQILQGAPADVFASANKQQMDVAIQSSEVISGTQRTFAHNRLVVVYPKDNPAQLATLADLARPGVKIVLANNNVPVGAYALDFLAKASQLPEYTETYSATVLKNIVSYEENVRSVLSKIMLGEADAGVVYTSDIALETADQVGRLDIPDQLNTIASYPIATLKSSKNPDMARMFVDYVLSAEAQRILGSYGFIPNI